MPSARTSAWESEEGVANFPAQLVEVIKASSEGAMPYDRPNVIAVGQARDIVGTVIVTAIEGGNVRAAAERANSEYQMLLDKESRVRIRNLSGQRNFLLPYLLGGGGFDQFMDRQKDSVCLCTAALIFVILMMVFPIVYTLRLSLQNGVCINAPPEWIIF